MERKEGYFSESEIQHLVTLVDVSDDGRFWFTDEFWEFFNDTLGDQVNARLDYLSPPWDDLPRSLVSNDLLKWSQKNAAVKMNLPKITYFCSKGQHVYQQGKTKCEKCRRDFDVIRTKDSFFEASRKELMENMRLLDAVEPIQMTPEQQAKVRDFLDEYGDVIDFLVKVGV